MKIYSNDKLIKRNKFLSRVTLILGLGFMGFAFITLLNTEVSSSIFIPSMIAGVIGIVLSTINIPLSARFGASPRPDELISAALKGLDNSFSLYHYTTPVPHLLLGPNGIWVFNTYVVQGKVTYDSNKNKWKLVKSGRFFNRIFGSEGLGNPSLEAEATEKDFLKLISRFPEIQNLPDPMPVAVFTSKDITLEVDDAPFLTVSVDKVKASIRKNADLPEKQKAAVKELIRELNP
jgi:hypothetical protein